MIQTARRLQNEEIRTKLPTLHLEIYNAIMKVFSIAELGISTSDPAFHSTSH